MKSTLVVLSIIGIVLIGASMTQLRSAQPKKAANSNLAPVKQESGIRAEGRVAAYPGAEVAVGSDMAGIVSRVAVQEKQRVRKGELLVELSSADVRASLDEARARLNEVGADIRLYESEVRRTGQLWQQEIGTKKEYERAQRDLEASRARLATTRAEIRRLEATVAKSRIVAPIDGVITLRAVDEGESVDRGTVVARVADLSKRRVEAEVDEFDAARVSVGQKVEIRADGVEATFDGHIEEVPDTVTHRALKPEDPARLSDTRILLAKVAFDGPTPLRLGQRVEIAIAAK